VSFENSERPPFRSAVRKLKKKTKGWENEQNMASPNNDMNIPAGQQLPPYPRAWKEINGRLKNKYPGLRVINVLVKPDPTTQHKMFMTLFNSAKSGKVPGPVVICTSLPYLFRGDDSQANAEWIGIPAMDVIAYVGVDNGRVGVTGRGQHEFLAMMLG